MPVDESLARLSDTLFGLAMAVYAAGMLGYAAEFAFSRFGRVSAQSVRPRPAASAVVPAPMPTAAAVAAEPVPTLAPAGVVSASVGSSTGGRAGGAGGPVPAADADPAGQIDSAARVRAAGGADAGAGGVGGGVDVGPGGDPPVPARARVVGIVAVALTVVGWVLHTGSIVTRGLAADRVPWGNMYEFSSMICLIAVTGFLLLLARQPARWLGVFVMVPVVLYLGFAGTVLYVAAGPLVPALNSYWLKIHVVAAIVASGIFLVSAVTTVLYLAKDRWETMIAEVAAGREEASATMRRRGGIVMRLPSADALDALTYRVIALAFPIWTFAVIAGAIWAEAAWGRYWGWDPKETWSFITWVVYAAYLHARTTGGWKGRRAAVVSLVGFSALFVDYYLVNLVISGLHSYSGL
jgi:cytochrome c-type biogenesis protein CcsB